MAPETLVDYVAAHQNALWIFVVLLDLGVTLLLFRVFGKVGLYAVIVLNIMLSNLIGSTTPKDSPFESRKLMIFMGFSFFILSAVT